MIVTFLIGNGFDLGMGMRSRFDHYFPIFCKDHMDENGEYFGLAKAIKKDTELWSDFERQLGRYTVKFSMETKGEFIRQFQEFEDGFIEYLSRQQDSLNYENTEQIKKIFVNGLRNFYSKDILKTQHKKI